MSEGYRHDPVSAIAEAEATGETAVIFADIRQTMQLPLITSIWRRPTWQRIHGPSSTI